MVQFSDKKKKKMLKQFLNSKRTVKDLARENHTSRWNVLELLFKQFAANICQYSDRQDAEKLEIEDGHVDEEVAEIGEKQIEEVTSESIEDVSEEMDSKPKCYFNHAFNMKRCEFERLHKNSDSDFMKYGFDVIIEIVEQFLNGTKTITELANKYDVPKYVIFTWIETCYEDVQNMMGVKGRVVENYDLSHPYSEKFKKMVVNASLKCDLAFSNHPMLFGISWDSLMLWRHQYAGCCNIIDVVDLDDLVVDMMLRKRLAKTEIENRALKKEIEALKSLQSNSK